MEEGNLELALLAAVIFLGGLILETRVLTRFRWTPYFAFGLPLAPPLVPVPRAPEGEGRTATVKWEVAKPELVRFWAPPGERSAPMGLHGVVHLARGRRGVELAVRWSPPFSPLFAAIWLGVLGVLRDEAHVTLPIGAAIVFGVLIVYLHAARRAAAELRWAFVRGHEGDGEEDEPGSGYP